MNKCVLIVCVVAVILLLVVLTGHMYHGLNAGIVWNWGGFEWRGVPGFFLCTGQC